MPWGKHPGCLRTCKGWWWGNRVSWSSETCTAQGRGVSGLAKKGLITAVRKRWTGRQKNPKLLKEKCAEKASGSRSKAAWTRWQKQTRAVGPQWGSRDPPFSFQQKAHEGLGTETAQLLLGQKVSAVPRACWSCALTVRTGRAISTHSPWRKKLTTGCFSTFFSQLFFKMMVQFESFLKLLLSFQLF